MSAQSTDAENSKPLGKATNAGDALSQISSRSAQHSAREEKSLAGKGGTDDAVPAPIPGHA